MTVGPPAILLYNIQKIFAGAPRFDLQFDLPAPGLASALAALLDVDLEHSFTKASPAFALRAGVRRSKPLPAIL